MAEVLTSLQIVFKLVGTLTNATDLSTLSDTIAKDYSQLYGNGTGANQANMWWHDQRTIAASGTENLDLAGSLVSNFGTTITMTSFKGIVVFAATGNTNDVQVTRPASNGVPWLMAAGDGIALKPGDLFAWFTPAANGPTVTAGTGDLITITNSSSGTGVTYDVFLLGEV